MERNFSARPRVLAGLAIALIALTGCSGKEREPASAANPAPLSATSRDYVARIVNPELKGGIPLPDGKAMLAWGSDGTVLRSEDGLAWTHVPADGIDDLAAIGTDASGQTLVAVGEKGAILRSRDGGRSFQAAKNDTRDVDLRAVAWHPHTGAWIAAGTAGRVLRSTDEGLSWRPVSTGTSYDLHTAIVDARTGHLLIGGEEATLGISTDGGINWTLTKVDMPDPVAAILKFFRHDELLLGAGSHGRIFTSFDDGKTWQAVSTPTAAMFVESAADPKHGSIVLTGHDGTVMRSTDAGRSWEPMLVTTEGRGHYLSGAWFDAKRGALLLIGHNGSIARSDNGGAGWMSWSLGTMPFAGLIADATRDRVVVFGPGGLLMNSDDGGASWRTVSRSLDVSLRDVEHAPESSALVATGKLGAVVRSIDRGATWASVEPTWPNPNTPPELRMIIPTPANDALLAVGPPGTIVQSSADGSAWKVTHFTPIEAERAFTWAIPDPQRAQIVAIEARGQMQRSADAGASWRPSVAPTQGAEWPFWHGARLDSGTLIVAGKSGVAARSIDGGATWTALRTGTDKDLQGSFADRDLAFLVGNDGVVLRSSDDGASWMRVASGTEKELRRMLRDPRSDGLVCFGTYGAMLRSDDRGLTWRVLPTGTDGALRKGIADPASGQMFVAGSRGAILRSRDGGRSWERLPSHTRRHFQSLALLDNGDLVVVGERIARLVKQPGR
jgi:photosystem II stability/assembly factor-like uncharacterized protein